MKLYKPCLFALMGIILLLLTPSAFAANDRPLIFGQNPIGTNVWGYDPSINDPKEFDKIAESGGTSCRIGVNWDQIERVRGTRDWSSIDPWVKYCIDRGINPVILINSTPTWALPTVNPTIPVPQARYAPRADCLADFDSFVFELVRRYRGRAQYYEFWNEANGYGWHWDGGFGRADEYVPLMKRAYIQVKLADPTAKMSLTGIDDNGGGAIPFMQAVYSNGGRGYFDAVAEHPYSPGLIQESKLYNLRNTLDNQGDNDVDIWITEMGWTANGREDQVAGWIIDYFTKLVNNHPTVKIATYHTAMDFPQEDYGYGLLDRYLKPKVTWMAFKNFAKPTRPTAFRITVTKLSASGVRINFNTDISAKSVVMYGQTNLYGMVTGKETSTSTSHQITLTGLKPATTYHYRVRTGAVDYGDNYSLDYTFTTDAGPVVRILTVPTISSVTFNSAIVSWTTDVPATAEVQYGRDFNYGSSVTDSTPATSHSLVLQNLSSGTNYQFKVVSTASGYADAAVEGTPFTTVTVCKIAGYVRTTSGVAIPGATVTTFHGGYTATTDNTGYYEISGIPAATYSVTASQNEYISLTKTGVVVTMGVTATADFNLVTTASSLSNPGFEDGFSGSGDYRYGNSWTVFVSSGSAKYTSDVRRHSGSNSQVFYESGITAGLYQQCGAVNGQPYTASVWVAAFQYSAGNFGTINPSFWIGIDPTGRTSPSSVNIVWSSVCNPGGTWTKVSVNATAASNGITVFLKTSNTAWPLPYCCFDDASLVNSTGGIIGTVKNTPGSAISGASVVTTPGSYTVQSDVNGAYIISDIPVGTYTVTASKSGYTSQSMSNVSVTGVGNETADITLSDASAPTVPTVIDDGNYTFNLSQIYASWSSNDPETGVAEYQYAVRSESGDYVVNWTSAGTNTSTFIPATLTAGTKYYIDVKARNGEGQWSAVGSSDGVTARASMTIAEAKGMDNTEVYVAGIVTAKFDEGGALRFYIESSDRSCGIGVETTSSVTLGDEVRVHGAISNLNGERVITFGVPIMVQSGVTIPKPISLTNKALGGGPMGLQAALLNNAASNTAAVGLNNIGLLVNVWGNVTYLDSGNNFFYINDGSGITDGSGNNGVKVACTGLPVPTIGDYAIVKGVSAVAWVNGKAVRLVRPSSSSDLTYTTNP